MKLRVANAPVSWAVFTATAPSNPPWERVLDEVARSGYRQIELGPIGFMPTDPAVLMPALASRGLAVPGTFIYDDIHRPAERDRILDLARATCRLLSEVGASNLVVINAMSPERMATAGRAEAATRLERSAWEELVRMVDAIGRIAADYGLKAVFHPHAGTYVEFIDEVDQLLSETDPAFVDLCIDTGHSAYAGIDPVALALRYGSRGSYFHFKDIDSAVLQRVHSEDIDFDAALAAGIFCPLGRGMVDFPALCAALIQRDYDGFATVEQDIDPGIPADPGATAAESLSYLQSVGLVQA